MRLRWERSIIKEENEGQEGGGGEWRERECGKGGDREGKENERSEGEWEERGEQETGREKSGKEGEGRGRREPQHSASYPVVIKMS